MILRILAVVIVGVLIGAFATEMLRDAPRSSQGKIRVVAEDFMPSFTLTDQDGAKVSDKDLRGEYQLVYFGFTSCPEICPTEMQKVTNALAALPVELKEKIQPVFITVDPERDTEAALKSFLEPFDPSFIALRGTEKEIDEVMDGFKVYAQKADDPKLSDYTVNHSSYIYFISPEGDLLAIFRTEDSPETIEETMESAMMANDVPAAAGVDAHSESH